MIKKCMILLLSFLPCSLFVLAQESKEWRMAILSDIHVMAPELLQADGKAFQDYIAHDRKMLKESTALLREAVTALSESRPDVVLVTGDLTKDGERVSHELVAERLLRPLREKGIPVYVIPGNHDVNNPHAVVFDGDSVERTATVTPGEFADCYRDYGYGQALARDPRSLSYVVQLNDSTRLLAIDACRYEENDYERNTCVTGGRIRPETLDFIKEQASAAQADRCRLLVMMHHGLVRHWKWQDKVMSEYLVEDWKRNARLFAKLGLNVVFTGHFHAQDIAGYGKGRQEVFDIETGSTVSYPMPYRLAVFRDGEMRIASERIRQIPGFPEGALEAQARHFAETGITTLVGGMLPGKVPAEVSAQAGKVLDEAYTAHLAGDERMSDDYPARLKRACRLLRPYSWKYAFALRKLGKYLSTDLLPADNELTIRLYPIGADQ